MNDLSVLSVADAGDFFQVLARCIFRQRVVEFSPHHEIDSGRSLEALFRLNGHMRTDKGDLDQGVRVFDHLSQSQVALKSRRTGKEPEELVVLRDGDCFFGTYAIDGASSSRL